MSLRSEILEVSKDLLIENGFSGLSMRKIARRANVTATSIYLHFKNKDDLLLTLMQQSIEALKKELLAVLDAQEEPAKQLEKVCGAYIGFAMKNPKKYEIIYLVRPEAMPRYPREKFLKVRAVYEIMAELIQKGNDAGNFNVDDPLTAVYSIWGQLHGVVSVLINKRLDSRIPPDAFTRQSVKIIVQGLIGSKETTLK